MFSCYFGAVTVVQRRRLLKMKYKLMFFTACSSLAQQTIQKAGMIAPVKSFDYYDIAVYLFENVVKGM